MRRQSQSQTDSNFFLGIDLVMKKSYVFDEKLPSSHRVISNGTKSMSIPVSLPKQRTYLLIKKLRRIVYAKIRGCLFKISSYRRDKFYCGLMSTKSSRLLAQAFENLIKANLLSKSAQIQSRISRMKKNNMIFAVVWKLVKNTKKYAFEAIREQNNRFEISVNLIKIVESCYNRYRRDTIRDCFQERMKVFFIENNKLKKQASKSLMRALLKISRNLKSQIFNSVIKYIQMSEIQTVQSRRKDSLTVLNQISSEKSRNIMKQKQKLRNTKHGLDSESAHRNKIKYEKIRDVNLLKSKNKEEMKIIMKSIADLEKTNRQLEAYYEDLIEKNRRRVNSIRQSKGSKQLVMKYYGKFYRQPINLGGELKSQLFYTPVLISQVKKIEDSSEYHCYINEKLKQYLRSYENTPKWSAGKQEQLVIDQNVALKGLIRTVIYHKLESYCQSGNIMKIANDQ